MDVRQESIKLPVPPIYDIYAYAGSVRTILTRALICSFITTSGRRAQFRWRQIET